MSIFREHKTSADRSANDRSRHKQKIEKEEWQNLLKEGYKIDKNGNKYSIEDLG